MNIHRIMFPTDFSDTAKSSLNHALVLAHRFSSTLVLFHVEVPYESDPYNPGKQFPTSEEMFKDMRKQVEKHIKDPDLPMISGNIKIEEHTRRSLSPAYEILEFSKSENIDMIVMGTHGRTGLGHFLLGSTTEKVIHNCELPLLTIGHGQDIFVDKGGRYERILIPVDFSTAGKEAIRVGIALSIRFNAEVVFTHVVEPVFSSQALFAGVPSAIEIDSELNERSEKVLKNHIGDMLPDSYIFKLNSGMVHQEIINTCDEFKCDLMVIANKGWSALDRLLLGSTTEKLIRSSPVPVLVVR